MSDKPKYPTREEWLIAATDAMRPLFKQVGNPIPDAVQVSTGWPSRGATSSKSRRIGECWDASCAEDKRPHVFISPVLDNTGNFGVLPTLLHEHIHAAVGNKCGHKGPFKRVAKALGLQGKMTATTASPELMTKLDEINKVLGPYPHGPLHNVEKRRTKRDECRLLKCECEDCGYTLRTTKKWLESKGAPLCPCNKQPMSYGENESEGEE